MRVATYWRKSSDDKYHVLLRHDGAYAAGCGTFTCSHLTSHQCLRPARKHRCGTCDAVEEGTLGPRARRRGVGFGKPYRWKGAEPCKWCKTPYGRFRTGYSYRTVFDMLMDYDPDPAKWRYKRPGTVLGVWHAIKRKLWEEHQVECAALCRDRRRTRARTRALVQGYCPRRLRKREQRALIREYLEQRDAVPF